KYFDRTNISNATLLSQLDKNDYETLVRACDVGLIFLDHRFTIPNIPSRLLSYMDAQLPVLAATDINTDLGSIIENGDFGYWCESTDVKKFTDKLELMCDSNNRRRMGENARKYLEANFTVKHTYEIIMSNFISESRSK